MKLARRSFLGQVSVATAAIVVGKPIRSAASIGKTLYSFHAAPNSLTVFHTGDSRGTAGSGFTGKGGLLAVKTTLRQQKTNGLLLDNGNFLGYDDSAIQNYRAIALMNQMGYFAAAPGQHELSGGQDALAKMIPAMNFSLVNCNYQFGPALGKLVAPYLVTFSGKIKIGITGVGDKVSGVGFNDPMACANGIARLLKEKEKCNLVICLSRLGFSRNDDEPGNRQLAKMSEHIDLIIGKNSKTPTSGNLILLNKNKHEVLIGQAAPNGQGFGKISLDFLNGKQKSMLKAKSFFCGVGVGDQRLEIRG